MSRCDGVRFMEDGGGGGRGGNDSFLQCCHNGFCATPRARYMTAHPVTLYRHCADLSLYFLLMLIVAPATVSAVTQTRNNHILIYRPRSGRSDHYANVLGARTECVVISFHVIFQMFMDLCMFHLLHSR